jgi:hypothetical protein
MRTWCGGNADSFLRSEDVREAIGAGQTELGDLRRLAESDVDDAELKPLVDEMADEFARARETLAPEAVADQIRAADYDWDKFRKGWRDLLPAPIWPAVWRDVFRKAASELYEADAQQRQAYEAANPLRGFGASLMLPNPETFFALAGAAGSDVGAIRVRHHDELLAAPSARHPWFAGLRRSLGLCCSRCVQSFGVGKAG